VYLTPVINILVLTNFYQFIVPFLGTIFHLMDIVHIRHNGKVFA